MSTHVPLTPPEPVDRWLADLALVAGPVDPRGSVAFDGTGEPWSAARRFDGGVQLEWAQVRFEVSADCVVVDADQPLLSVDLYWNTLVATVLELRGITCLHGFMVESPDGEGLAVLGNSGAGKTTTGLALLEMGCTLVCDDLVTLSPGAAPTARPFLRRLRTPGEEVAVDVGGKVREPQNLVHVVPTLTRMLCLDETADSPAKLLDSMSALDHLLRNPYVPFDLAPDAPARRLADLAGLLDQTEILAATPRSQTPVEFAQLLLDGLR